MVLRGADPHGHEGGVHSSTQMDFVCGPSPRDTRTIGNALDPDPKRVATQLAVVFLEQRF